jgi:predicted NAD/FAD-binding protein
MPKRKGAWSSWNYLGASEEAGTALCVTYWMNRLQGLDADRDLFVTLNPYREPLQGSLYRSEIYEHPVFDAEALRAQARLPGLQGKRNTWFCGAYFGAGFHEDGLKSGLAVAEMLGGVELPWGGGAARYRPGLHAEAAIELVS